MSVAPVQYTFGKAHIEGLQGAVVLSGEFCAFSLLLLEFGNIRVTGVS
jgi:hypothetical protein